MVLDAEVDAVAECLTISVLEPGRISVDEAIAVTRRAYAPIGIELERTASQLVFSRAEDAELPGCSAHRRIARSPAPPTPAQSASLAQVRQTVRAGIRTVSADEVLLTRAAAAELRDNQAVVLRTVRVIPHEENGRVVSIKMYGIRRNSIMGSLGFLNGDGIQRINGYDVTSPDSALEAYARARGASEIRVELQRRGQAVTRIIRVVESLP